MADVQLEHGHVRIANALEEALIFAKFSATQMKIVRCIIRLTWGWRARTVRISYQDLALRCNTTAAGGFRKEFEELVREGVITVLEHAHGRTPGVYSLNKDFERWGRLSVPASALTALFSDRPAHVDGPRRVPSQGQSTVEESENRVPSEGQSNSRRVPSNEQKGALLRAPKSTGKGSLISVSDCPDSELDPPKDSRKTEKDITAAAKGDGAAAAAGRSAEERRYAQSLADAANRAITDRWGVQDRPIEARGGVSLEIARALVTRQIPIEIATAAIAEKVRTGSFGSVPFSLKYFADAIVEAYQADLARRRQRDASPSRTPETAGVIADREQQELALQDAYVAARAPVVAAWRADPAHADELRAIEAAALAEFPDDNPWNKPAREPRVLQLIAAAAGFPDFDTWKTTRPARAS